MKKQTKIGLIGFFILAILTACDSFILPPAFNLNPEDPNQAFGRLESALIDKGKVRVIWDWYDLERRVRGVTPVYDEVIIKHSRGNYPTSRLGGVSFEIKDWDPATNPLGAATFSDLKDDREHYFALYAHEKDGRWVGPMYTSTYFDGFEYDVKYPVASHSIAAYVSSGTTVGEGLLTEDQANMFYYQDLWEDEIVTSAEITLDVTGVSADGTIVVYPMRNFVEDSDADGAIDQGITLNEISVDRSIRVEFPIVDSDTGLKNIDISSIMAKAQYHRHNGILLMMTPGTSQVNISTPVDIEVEIARSW